MKTKLSIALLSGMLLIVLTGCATAEKKAQDAGHTAMTQAELEQFHARTRNASWRNPSTGGSGSVTYNPDGTASVTWGGGSDQGNWEIRNGMFCNKWNTVRGGSELCTRIYHIGDNEYQTFDASGKLQSVVIYD